MKILGVLLAVAGVAGLIILFGSVWAWADTLGNTTLTTLALAAPIRFYLESRLILAAFEAAKRMLKD